MNIFILCTGRCGSKTFINACSHINNYTSSHESRTNMLGQERFSYPKNHIEADNRLSWLLGRLDRVYGDTAFYVHLIRNKYDTAYSFVKRYDRGIIKAYRGMGIIMGLDENIDPLLVSLDYYDTVNSNIHTFLKTKPNKMIFHLENAKHDFLEFCNFIRAEVELEPAKAEFDLNYNSS